MVEDELIPELHDIGKLIDWETINPDIKGHNFENVNMNNIIHIQEPSNKTWKGIKLHHKKSGDIDIFILKLADHIASGISRALPEDVKDRINRIFKWDKIPGTDDDKLRRFLIDELNISWADESSFIKSSENKIILSSKGKFVDITRDDITKKAILRIHDGRTYELSILKNKEDEIEIHRQKIDKSFQKLWNERPKNSELFSTKDQLKEIIEYIKKDNSGELFLANDLFHKKLLSTPEDQMPPMNITSLYTHSKLVGKLYYFFKPLVTDINCENNLLQFRSSDESINVQNAERKWDLGRNIKNAETNWDIKLLYCKINFPDYQARVRDLNIFELLKKELEKLSKAKNVILQTSDQFLAFLPVDKKIDDLVKPFIEKGFNIYVEEAITKLQEATPTPRAIKQRKMNTGLSIDGNSNFDVQFSCYTKYKYMEPLIDPHICEICQLAPASEPPWIDEGLVENICVSCRKIREYDESVAPQLKDWYQSEQLSKVAWIKIYLDINLLSDILKKLYKSYSDKYIKDIDLKAEIEQKDLYELHFSVLTEFQQDYDDFLIDFNKKIEYKFKLENIQPILNDFICVKIERTSQIKDILEIYNQLFTNYFPQLKDQKSPVTLSISVSNVKFAFFRHWKNFENPKNDVNVNLIGRGEMHLSLNLLEKLIHEFKIPASKQLHKLAKISEASEKLAKVLVYDRGDYRVYESVRVLSNKIDFKTILTYAKIMGDEE
ncbi:MAG: hypothetical protein WC556_06360 [Candidatus Methanoperedens sp.]